MRALRLKATLRAVLNNNRAVVAIQIGPPKTDDADSGDGDE